jgi:hypothetical protein
MSDLAAMKGSDTNTDIVASMTLLVSALIGLVVCLFISVVTGRNEAWDSPLYFSLGIPVMCLAIIVISFLIPEKPWRWVAAMAFGQSVALALGGGSLTLWPLAIVAMLLLSLPQMLAAFVASRLALRRT